jgi:serine/threonine protein kinase
MEYLPSTSLAGLGTLPYQEVARIGAEAAGALAAAHEAGVVHRDIKPANILVGKDGTVKITDFGISRVVADITATVTGTFAGTPAYLAPEVAKGEQTTFATDVYSLGATLYAAVEGKPPAGTDSNPMALLYRVASGKVERPANAGPLADVLMSLLSTDPDKRPTAHEAKAALAAIADPEQAAPAAMPAAAPAAAPVPAAAPAQEPTPKPEGEPGRRRRAVIFAAALLVVAVVAAVVTTLLNRPDEPSQAGNPPADTTTKTTTSSQPAQPTTSGEATTTTSTTTTTTTTPPANPPSNPPAAPPAADPVSAVTSYYGLMPGNRAQAWNRLTPKFQQSPAGGPSGYEQFWSQISAVTASEPAAAGAGAAEVTVLYTFNDGHRIRERHRYFLVNQGGQWLIDRVTVLSTGPA